MGEKGKHWGDKRANKQVKWLLAGSSDSVIFSDKRYQGYNVT